MQKVDTKKVSYFSVTESIALHGFIQITSHVIHRNNTTYGKKVTAVTESRMLGDEEKSYEDNDWIETIAFPRFGDTIVRFASRLKRLVVI